MSRISLKSSRYTDTCMHLLHASTPLLPPPSPLSPGKYHVLNPEPIQNFIQLIVQLDCYLPSTQDHTPSSPLYNTSLWGPTCDGLDKICDVVMPELAVGDWLYFDDMGAYTVSAFSSFNGFLRPKIYYCVSEINWYAILLSCLISYPYQPSLIPIPT